MKVSELKELAKAATPGPWGYDDGHVLCGDGWGFCSQPSQYSGGDLNPEIPEGIDSDKDSEFIAAANPATMLALIERVEKLGEALKEISEVKDYGDSLYQGIGIHPLKNQIALNALSLYGPDKELG